MDPFGWGAALFELFAAWWISDGALKKDEMRGVYDVCVFLFPRAYFFILPDAYINFRDPCSTSAGKRRRRARMCSGGLWAGSLAKTLSFMNASGGRLWLTRRRKHFNRLDVLARLQTEGVERAVDFRIEAGNEQL